MVLVAYIYSYVYIPLFTYLHIYIKSISITLTLLFWLCMNTYISVAHASSRDETGGLHALWTSHVYWTEEHQGDAPRLASSAVTIPRGLGWHAGVTAYYLMMPWQSLTWRWVTWDVSFGMSRWWFLLITPKITKLWVADMLLKSPKFLITFYNREPTTMYNVCVYLYACILIQKQLDLFALIIRIYIYTNIVHTNHMQQLHFKKLPGSCPWHWGWPSTQ